MHSAARPPPTASGPPSFRPTTGSALCWLPLLTTLLGAIVGAALPLWQSRKYTHACADGPPSFRPTTGSSPLWPLLLTMLRAIVGATLPLRQPGKYTRLCGPTPMVAPRWQMMLDGLLLLWTIEPKCLSVDALCG